MQPMVGLGSEASWTILLEGLEVVKANFANLPHVRLDRFMNLQI
jgi:hypothetical protein